MNTVTISLERFKELEKKEALANTAYTLEQLKHQVDEQNKALDEGKIRVVTKFADIEGVLYYSQDEIIKQIINTKEGEAKRTIKTKTAFNNRLLKEELAEKLNCISLKEFKQWQKAQGCHCIPSLKGLL